jgi:hypothetical protein
MNKFHLSYVTIWQSFGSVTLQYGSQLRYNMGIWSLDELTTWIDYISNAFYMVYHLSVILYTLIHVVFNSWIRFTIEALLMHDIQFSSLYFLHASMTCHFDLAKQLLICIIVYTESFSSIGAPKYFSLVTLQYGDMVPWWPKVLNRLYL